MKLIQELFLLCLLFVELFIIALLNGVLWFWQIVIYYAIVLVSIMTVFDLVKIYRVDPNFGPSKIVSWIVLETLFPPVLTIIFVGKSSPPHVWFQIANIIASSALVFWVNFTWKWKERKKH